MKNLQSTQENNQTVEAPLADSGSVSASSNDNRNVSRQDIELVQNLIERCLLLYMNRDEVVKILDSGKNRPWVYNIGVAEVGRGKW
ncbi:hypothetical protein SLA2020_204010 [Shorea laevis]